MKDLIDIFFQNKNWIPYSQKNFFCLWKKWKQIWRSWTILRKWYSPSSIPLSKLHSREWKQCKDTTKMTIGTFTGHYDSLWIIIKYDESNSYSPHYLTSWKWHVVSYHDGISTSFERHVTLVDVEPMLKRHRLLARSKHNFFIVIRLFRSWFSLQKVKYPIRENCKVSPNLRMASC